MLFSGANSNATGPPAFPAFRAHKPLLRVVGAVPVPRQPRAEQQACEPPKRVRHLPSGPARAALLPPAAEAAPRQRRRWTVGQPVTLITSEGELLYMPPSSSEGCNQCASR